MFRFFFQLILMNISSSFPSSDGVGTDTPPQTPPNAKTSNGQNSLGQAHLLSNSLQYMTGHNNLPNGYGLGGPISNYQKNSLIPMGQNNEVQMNSSSQRYLGNSINSNSPANMVSTAFASIYKR